MDKFRKQEHIKAIAPKGEYMNIAGLVLAAAVLFSGCSLSSAASAQQTETPTPTAVSTVKPTATPTPSPTPTVKPVSEDVIALKGRNEKVAEEKTERPWMAGRLIIQDADIDVALFLYNGTENVAEHRQEICDAYDSAVLYYDGFGNVIADHNNQGFTTLNQVKVGDKAFILTGDSILSLKCDYVTDGTNTGEGITDANGKWVTENEDFVCYTCGEDWTHIRIVGFEVTDEDVFTVRETVSEDAYLAQPAEDSK